MLEVSRDGRVLRLTLNRPEKRNALNGAVCRELVSAIEKGYADSGLRAILLLGAGSSFCAGMDLSEMLTPEASTLADIQERLFTIGRRATVPIIAAVQGAALAGGTGLVANAHIVVAAEDATFGLTEIRIGLWPFLIHRAVVDAIGERRTLELEITGRIFSASKAMEMGLVHFVTPATDLLARAQEIAAGVAAVSPTAIRTGLEFVAGIRGLDWEEGGQIAKELRETLFHSEEFAEGIRAFREKRPPRWS